LRATLVVAILQRKKKDNLSPKCATWAWGAERTGVEPSARSASGRRYNVHQGRAYNEREAKRPSLLPVTKGGKRYSTRRRWRKRKFTYATLRGTPQVKRGE